MGPGKPGLIEGKPAVLKGSRGAVVEILDKTGGVAVEFFDDAGGTIGVAFIPEAYVRPATKQEIAESQAITDRLNREPIP